MSSLLVTPSSFASSISFTFAATAPSPPPNRFHRSNLTAGPRSQARLASRRASHRNPAQSRGLHDSHLFARLGRRGPSPARSGGPHRHRELRARFTGLPERVGEPRARERAPEAQVVRAHVGAATRDSAAWIRDHHAVAPPHEPHEHPLGPHPPTPETRAPRLLGHAGAPVSSEAPLGSDAATWAATHSTAAAWIASAREPTSATSPSFPGPAFTIAAGEPSPAATSGSTSSAPASAASAARSTCGRPSLAVRSASTSASLLMSMRMPVSLAASRAFWPFLPIASESWLSGTMTSADG